MVLTSGYLLMGLRYNKSDIDAAFTRANAMMESSTYRGILEDGMQKGRQEGRQKGQLLGLREALLDLLAERFGQLPVELVAGVTVATDVAQLRAAIRSAGKIADLAEFRIPG